MIRTFLPARIRPSDKAQLEGFGTWRSKRACQYRGDSHCISLPPRSGRNSIPAESRRHGRVVWDRYGSRLTMEIAQLRFGTRPLPRRNLTWQLVVSSKQSEPLFCTCSWFGVTFEQLRYSVLLLPSRVHQPDAIDKSGCRRGSAETHGVCHSSEPKASTARRARLRIGTWEGMPASET